MGYGRLLLVTCCCSHIAMFVFCEEDRTKTISSVYDRYEQKAPKILQYFKLCDSLPALTEVFPVIIMVYAVL